MAESFNELDGQHEWEEITHTRVQRVQAQYTLCNDTTTDEYKHGTNRYITQAGHARTLYKRYKHSTHCAVVQPQYEYKHWPIDARPVLAMLNHCTGGTRTVHTVQWYAHSVSTRTGKIHITRAGHAESLYKRYKHSTHCAMVQPQYEYKHRQKVGTLPVLAIPNHCTRGTSTVHTVRRYKYSTSTNAGK